MVDAAQIIEQAEVEREEMQSLLRPVAEFFHSHEGELFERYEAVSKLITADSIPSSDERTLHQVVGNLAADRVDPVQNVVRDSDKYVGVLEYEEHDFWYEYVEVDDVRGRQNVGVCAQCVKDADNDAQVAKGIGTTEELADRIRDHYGKEHSESPESVETGATLVSGTTIAGNDAITSATDGAGSGLDADTFRGTEGSTFVSTGNEYMISDFYNLQSEFSSPSAATSGIGLDSNDSLWISDDDLNAVSIYQVNQTGTIVGGIPVNVGNADSTEDVGVDTSDCIWNIERSSESVYRADQSGNVEVTFTSPSYRPVGLGVNSSDSLWLSASGTIYKLNQSGTVQKSIVPDEYQITGIGIDSSDSLWVYDYSTEGLYNISQNGDVTENISSVPSPGYGNKGVGVDSQDVIWIGNNDTDSIYSYKYNIKFQ